MGKFTKSQTTLGDIHAPVEDTNVPFSLKALVILMMLLLVGFSGLIAWLVTTVR